jgi:hypothetical protein
MLSQLFDNIQGCYRKAVVSRDRYPEFNKYLTIYRLERMVDQIVINTHRFTSTNPSSPNP